MYFFTWSMIKEQFSHVKLYLIFFLVFFFLYQKISGNSTPLIQKERCPEQAPKSLFWEHLISRSLAISIMATQYILCGGQLYRRSYDGIHLHCLKKEEAKKVMEEVHRGICGLFMNGRMLAKKILRMGYYWNTMETDCVDYVKSCHDC